MIPLLISPEGLNVLVVGGGQVALRKCIHFKGADITVISEKTLPEIEDLAKTVIKKRTTSSEIQKMMREFDIVIAATDDSKMNSEIKDEALRAGCRINSAHGGGNVVIPSVLRKKGYTVSVSTEGKLPAFPPFVVKELDTFLDERFDIMFDVLAGSRTLCAGKGTQKERSEFLRKVALDPEVNAFARNGDEASAMKRAGMLGVPQ